MNLKKLLITLAKIALSLVIIGYLFYSALKTLRIERRFVEMLSSPRHWGCWLLRFRRPAIGGM